MKTGKRIHRTMTKAQAKQFDETWAVVRERLGSYNRMAQLVSNEAGQTLTGPGINLWAQSKNFPLDWALIIAHLAGVDVLDLCPWAREYMECAA